VFYSDGPEEIPDVVGMTQEEAEQTLREAGYVPDVVESANTTEPKGTVIQQSPPAGQNAPEGSTVTIVVSNFQEEPSESPSPTETPTETPTLPTETPPARRGDLPPGRVEGP
jgi:serine/threonine-protein kinase